MIIVWLLTWTVITGLLADQTLLTPLFKHKFLDCYYPKRSDCIRTAGKQSLKENGCQWQVSDKAWLLTVVLLTLSSPFHPYVSLCMCVGVLADCVAQKALNEEWVWGSWASTHNVGCVWRCTMIHQLSHNVFMSHEGSHMNWRETRLVEREKVRLRNVCLLSARKLALVWPQCKLACCCFFVSPMQTSSFQWSGRSRFKTVKSSSEVSDHSSKPINNVFKYLCITHILYILHFGMYLKILLFLLTLVSRCHRHEEVKAN